MSLIRPDARARQILFDNYWSSSGWVARQLATSDDIAYARAAGYMFEPLSGTHDAWVDRALTAASRATLEEAASAFVASLGSRDLAARSALGSVATAHKLTPHRFQKWSATCGVCNTSDSWRPEDLNVLSFERHKWGGVRHGQPIYAWFDLDVFAKSERPTETSEDLAILNAILDAARNAPPEAHPRDLERTIAPLLPSNRAERDVLLGILGLCGILAPVAHPGLMQRWVPYKERVPPPRPSKNDWLYPVFLVARHTWCQ